jgi:hypothetical protein
MSELTLQQQLALRYHELDARAISPPIEIGVGDYAFYPYRGFSDVLAREDFKKLSPNQLRTLIKIADDILAMQRPELFEAFVNDDGTIVVDKAQPHIEYSVDIEYNDARSRVEEIYPQVTYPQSIHPKRIQDGFVRNDTAHEVTHHIDFWLNMESKKLHLDYLHSSSVLLAWLKELDQALRPDGVADLIEKVRHAEGYVPEVLLEEGYTPQKVDQMMRAEFFAIAGEYYYGSEQVFAKHSPLLEAYMMLVLDTDLEIQRLYIPFKDMEARRGVLRHAIHASVESILAQDADIFHTRRQAFDGLTDATEKQMAAHAIEQIVISAMRRLIQATRQKIKLGNGSDSELALQ